MGESTKDVTEEKSEASPGETGMNRLPGCNRTRTAGHPAERVPGMNGLVTTPSLRQPGDLRTTG
jgi:hypothetical protein